MTPAHACYTLDDLVMFQRVKCITYNVLNPQVIRTGLEFATGQPVRASDATAAASSAE